MKRKLATILAADVVGYSRLMEHDEAGTLATLQARRKQVLEPLVTKYHGRIFKVMGDGVLVEFDSAVNAVECAVELQNGMATANSGVSEDRHIVLRIGINLGDLLVEGGDRYGEGVNVAARLEALAEPGSVLVSSTTYDHVQSKIKVGFQDLGTQSLKNIAQPVRVYQVVEGSGQETPRIRSKTDKPSIALLPFVNMCGDPGQEFFANAVTENIITGLSKFRDLLVIASTSTFTYKGKSVKIEDVSRELGVQYVLEGSVQKAGDRVRITAQLIDGDNGRHVWAERYDRGFEDIFAVQDEVTDMIVASLAAGYGGRLRKAWQSRSEQIGTRNFQAYDYLQRGMDTFNRYTREDLERAREIFQNAIELDPKYAKPYAKISWSHICDVNLGWSEDSAASFDKALEFAKLAVARDDDEPWGYWAMAGYYLFCTQEHNRAVAAYDKALEINPNDADVLNDFGQCLSYAGRANEAVEVVRRAMRLNPHYPEYWVMQFGPILFDARHYEDSIATLGSLRSVDTISVQLYLAASYAALGQRDKARKAIDRVLQLDPKMTITRCSSPEISPYKDPNDLEHFRRHLREAGLPE